jgi:hypothetical protein
MRYTLIGLSTLFAAWIGAVQPSDAAPRAWCIDGGAYGRGSQDCSYYNLAQCRASASGAGGHCIRNPAFAYDRRVEPVPRRVLRDRY